MSTSRGLSLRVKPLWFLTVFLDVRLGRFVVAGLGAGVAWLLGAGCTVDAVNLEGKKCPCAAGYVCDGVTDTCVPEGKTGGSGGRAGFGRGGTEKPGRLG